MEPLCYRHLKFDLTDKVTSAEGCLIFYVHVARTVHSPWLFIHTCLGAVDRGRIVFLK